MKLELIPVLEIRVPVGALEKVGPRPASTFEENPLEWDEYQTRLLQAGGFADYPRIIKGSSFIHLDGWKLDDLRRLIQIHLMYEEEPVPPAESCGLFGGCVLFLDDAPVLVPQCCGEITDFYSWKNLSDPEFKAGYFCSEGHPMPHAKRRANQLVITCKDDWEEFQGPTKPEIIVDVNVLADAIEKAELRIQAFSNKIDELSVEFGVAKLSEYLVLSN